MSNNDMNRTVREFYKAVEGVKSKKTGGYDVQATVRRVEDGVAWVHIPDGVDETPARLTINAKEGDVVQVRVVNGRAFLVGNASAPPTDNTEAIKALSQADVATQAATIARLRAEEATTDAARAHEAADAAQQSADDAAQAASDAQDSADAAQDSADAASNALQSVVSGATTVEKAVSVMQTALEAVVDYDPTTDTTNEYFWHDANGAHVLGTDSGYRNDVDSSGMKIVQVSTEDTVAEFGASGAQIGKDDGAHMTLNSRTMQLVDGSGVTYLHVSDIENGGYVQQTISYIGDGDEQNFNLPHHTESVDAVEVNGVAQVRGTDYVIAEQPILHPYVLMVCFLYSPASGATIKITCTVEGDVKAFTFGYREESNPVGAYSSAEGYLTSATEPYSTASGYCTVADGSCAHAEGNSTVAAGDASHSEGHETQAENDYSHAGGLGTVAEYDSMTAIGQYNKRTNSRMLLSIGNGTSDNNRSNAMTVDWDGVVTAANFVAPNIKCGELYLNGNETNVGFSKNRSNDSAVSLSAGGTGKTLATVDLEKGKWIVMCKVAFPDASATSYVRACFNTTGNSSGADMQIPSNSGASTTLNFTKFVNAASTTTYYLSASSYVARTIAAGNGQLWAVKIQ